MAEVAKNGNCYWPQSCHKWQLFASWQKLPKLAIVIDLKVVTNGNYLLHGRSCQKWPIKGCILLPKMAINRTICNSIENLSHFFFSISGTFSSVIMLSKSSQKWQFLLTSKLPKMANEHTWSMNNPRSSHFQLSLFCINMYMYVQTKEENNKTEGEWKQV